LDGHIRNHLHEDGASSVVANISNNFAVLKGPWLSQDFVYSHRQLLALLFFVLDNHAYDRIDIDASRQIKEKLDCILLLLKPPVVVDLTKFIPETVAKMLQRIETNSTDDGMEGEESLKHFFSKKVKTGNHFQFYRSRGMNMLRNCGFRYSSIIIFN